jgi:hypothetical protein
VTDAICYRDAYQRLAEATVTGVDPEADGFAH